jgi:FMN phosphatase YigB (HAD superfamily)
MAKSLPEYLDWLRGRSDLIWPKPPAPRPLKATPFLKPLSGIRAVVWAVYGTLLRIDGGRLYHIHPQQLRMQIALEKTIEEFNMWHSMSRKPGAPWEYMLQQYSRLIEEEQLKPTRKKGDQRAIDSCHVWQKVIERLQRNEYQYDVSFYGGVEDLAQKVACFFHANLQGVAPTDAMADTLLRVAGAGLRQGAIDDGQSFTPAQLLHALQQQSAIHSLADLFSSGTITLSSDVHVRKPSLTLFTAGLHPFLKAGLEPQEILYISHRLEDDLAIAKQFGVSTALYAGDAVVCQVQPASVRDPAHKPDRLLTNVSQVSQILGI